MRAHTAGPWNHHIATAKVFGAETFVTGGNPERGVAFCSYWTNGATEEDAANARLIAAAPDLLDALYSMLNLEGAAQEFGGLDVKYHCDKARAAIAKAEGRQVQS